MNQELILYIFVTVGLFIILLVILCIYKKYRNRQPQLPIKKQSKAYVEIPDATDRKKIRAPTNPQQATPKNEDDSIAIKRKIKHFSSTMTNKKKNLTIKIPSKEEI